MKAVICGAGKMGMAIGYAMKRLGYNLIVVDNNKESLDKFSTAYNCETYASWHDVKHRADVCISSLPFHATFEAAKWAIGNHIRYCDLGGSVSVSEAIKSLAEKAKTPVMTDLGLAPGWINIMAEDIYRYLPDATDISMMVGGIPASKIDNPLNYTTTWSVDGLLNEYADDCKVLRDGKVTTVQGMSECENVVIHGMELECFNTSGASAHSIAAMKNRGMANCSYKTLRWRGHCELVKYFLKHDRDYLLQLLKGNQERDMVVMQVTANNTNNATITKSLIINPEGEFTAMQRATAFPIAVVADMLANRCFDGLSYIGYENIDTKKFNSKLDDLFE